MNFLHTLAAHVTWTNFLTVWGVVWAFATATQGVWKPGSGMSKFCHVVLSISPLDFVKAAKTLGSSLVPPVACLALFLLSCSAAQTTAAGPLEEAAVFSSQLNLCEQTAQTKAQADKCRAGVERFWCGDGGALSSSAGCDGGAAPKDGGGQ